MTEAQFYNSSIDYIGTAFVGHVRARESQFIEASAIMRRHALVTAIDKYNKGVTAMDIWPLPGDKKASLLPSKEQIEWMQQNEHLFPS
ncbi:MAG: hypothetical protein EKK63_15880 [Acinetobacter sp.]|uniref:hypothetical protein n=1 Tax=Acinetobacter sp. TaxID=472 RepID=UPI000FA1ACD5|nr:hypothetical protein [Acinetobacter sp.]RUP37048.1 MAG: hypothetical protein EKK63_15880 [Acinetobacter sp.]